MCRKLSLLVWPGNPSLRSCMVQHETQHGGNESDQKKKIRVGHVVVTRYCYAFMGRTKEKKGVRFCQNSYPRSMDRNTLCFASIRVPFTWYRVHDGTCQSKTEKREIFGNPGFVQQDQKRQRRGEQGVRELPARYKRSLRHWSGQRHA